MTHPNFWFNRLASWLWPSSQGDLPEDVYADMVENLYSFRKPILNGAITFCALAFAISYFDRLPWIAVATGAMSIPVIAFRDLNMRSFLSIDSRQRRRFASIFESRWMVLAFCYTGTMTVVFTTVMLVGTVDAKFTIFSVSLGNLIMSSARTGMVRSYVRIQAFLLASPVVIGLLFMDGVYSKIMIGLVFLFVSGTLEVVTRLRTETVAARTSFYREQQVARYDALTGLVTRSYFSELLEERLNTDVSVAVLYMDLDRFKAVNDTQGHAAGDQLLVMIAARLRATCAHQSTVVARFGGDEFVIMTSGDYMALAREIVALFADSFPLDSGDAHVGCSIGINTTAMSRDPNDLVRYADIALYEAKAVRGSAICVFDNTMEQKLNEQTNVERRLRLALERDEITPFYQPIVDVNTGELVSAEALARWHDSELGSVSPDVFIRIAESVGLIEQLGEQMLMRACMDATKWGRKISVAVNVSPVQLKNPQRLKAAVLRALVLSGLPGRRLELEITESAMVENFDEVQQTIRDITAMDVRVALDDFGTGYSSLCYLEKIPFSKVKIDRNLMIAATRNEAQEIVIRMVSQLARKLDSDVVVEGIETVFQSQTMTALGVTHAQGYLFGRPSNDMSRFEVQGVVQDVEPLPDEHAVFLIEPAQAA